METTPPSPSSDPSPEGDPQGFPHPPAWARDGVAALVAMDPDLARIEAAAGLLPWRTRLPGFPGLLRTICGQQISNQAANAIWGRLSALPAALDPAGLLTLDDATLCGVAGLSRPKAAHARALASAITEGRLRLEALDSMTDDAAIAHLSTVRGLGPWTAQVHLLFAHQRADIFPAGDVALAAALAHLRGLAMRPKPKELAELAQAWAPWRSLAARLLWHYWRHVTGRPAFE